MKRNGDNYISDTSCERITTRVCVPVNCDVVPGQPQCHDRSVPVIVQIPEEVSLLDSRGLVRTGATGARHLHFEIHVLAPVKR